MEGTEVLNAGETGSTGGENTELPNTEVTGAGADQGSAGEGGNAGGVEGVEGGTSVVEGEGGAGGKAEPDPVNKRFSEVTKQRDRAEREAREAREQLSTALEALKKFGKEEPKPADPTPQDDPEPEPPEFIDPEQYQRDMADYARKVTERTVKLQLRAAEANREREAAERANRTAQEEHARSWMSRRQKAMDEMPDYADVAENPDLPISQQMAIAITTSEHGPKIAYYLGQHPDEAGRIAKMNPVQQLMELGKLETQLSAPKKPSVSKAPAPIKPLSGSGEPQTKSTDEMSMDEYAAYRKSKR
jgi:hypothetical protein